MKKVILISGSTSGLGKATAQQLAKKHQVIVSSRDAGETKATAKELGVDFVVMDVTNYAQVESAVKQIIDKYGKIDCLINNAGIWFEELLEDSDPKKIHEMLEVNTLGTIWLTHVVLPYMKRAKNGRIINIISQSGLFAKPKSSVYRASKWAITGFTKSLQLELKGTGVTISGVYPGKIDTPLFEKAGVEDMDTVDALDVSDVVRTVEFIVETPNDVLISELGIKSTLSN